MNTSTYPSCGNQVWSTIEVNKNNQTALRDINAPPWVSTAEFRGTMSILQSCTLTLIACIYTAIHLDIPDDTRWWSMLRTKVQWIALALFAPEIVLFYAASQFFQALELRNGLKKLQVERGLNGDEFKFTLKYAFYVVMGGVRVRRADLAKFISWSDIDLKFKSWCWLEDGKGVEAQDNTFCLTPRGLLQLARYDHWIDITEERVNDRSKANQLQKTLVVFQVGWLALQCISRHYYGLPLTLLEVHTMVHIVCALCLYIFWFEKPLDIREADIVYDSSWDKVLAVIVQNTLYYYQTHMGVMPRFLRDAPHNFGTVNPDCVLYLDKNRYRNLSQECQDRFAAIESFIKLPQHATALEQHPLEGGLENILSNIHFELDQPGFSYKTANLDFKFSDIIFDLEIFSITARKDPRPFVLMVTLPIIYGAIHLSAWKFDFASPQESLLWRIACIGITLVTPGMFIIGISIVFMIDLLVFVKHGEWLRVQGTSMVFYYFLGTFAMVFYSLARVFIVVESFVGLRRVPIGVYWTPAWLQMIPHF